jgi:hypothetical protein
MRGIILEGIPGSGKSRLLDAVSAQWRPQELGGMWLATERLTERPLEPLSLVSPETACAHVNSHLRVLETMQKWETQSPGGGRLPACFVLERFHLSIACHVPGIPSGAVKRWETRLAKLGAVLVLLTVSPRHILRQCIQDTIRRRNSLWGHYLKTLAPTEPLLVRHFSREQARFREMGRTSRLPCFHLTADFDTMKAGIDLFRKILTGAIER